MYPPNPKQFEDFLIRDFGYSRFLVAEADGEVQACLVFDQFLDGLSSVYCFFNPKASEYSPGAYMIVRLTQVCQLLGLGYHYLGYWVSGCNKMEYKRQYQPLEQFKDGHWTPLTKPTTR